MATRGTKMGPRIDSLKPNQRVRLRFYNVHRSHEEDAIFRRMEGNGADRRAIFYTEAEPRGYEWEASRYIHRWVYGTSADRLMIISIERAEGSREEN